MNQSRMISRAKSLFRPAVHRYNRWRDRPDPRTVSYALDRLDRELESWLNFDSGIFIEAGANDGITGSNTL